MKIGFVTTQQHKNFGTFLQCYALQNVLQKLGHKVEIIDYKCKDLDRSIIDRLHILLGSIRRNPMEYLNFIKNYARIKTRDNLFNLFRKKYFLLSPQSYSTSHDLEINPPLYDLYLSGSDQIWNPSLNGFIKPYFLTFVPQYSKKASYAPSIGLSNLSSNQCEKMYNLLISYQHISCRETTGIKLLELCGLNNIEHVLDPTFLLSKEEWIILSESASIIKTNYNLSYFLEYADDKGMVAQQVLSGNKIIDLTVEPVRCQNSIIEAGPLEFLSLIIHADKICTDSYHGMIYAIIFEKEFYMVPRHSSVSEYSQNSRIQDLLELLDLSERWITNGVYPIHKIDYTLINNKLEKLKERSISYLISITND